MTKTIHGKAYGRTIELDADLGVSDGQAVEVQVKAISQTLRKPGDGFLRTKGALADDEEWDGIRASRGQTSFFSFGQRVGSLRS